MHPAYSVILFTTASGAGYGLLAWLGLFAWLDYVPPKASLGFAGLGLALALIVAGLLSSTSHLGRPERAWMAFSQWRTSWLSREGVAAIATFVPAGLLGIGWGLMGSTSGLWSFAALLSVVMALITVYCTGMIYQSLPTIRAWNTPSVTPIYVVLAIATGGLLAVLILRLFGAMPRFFDFIVACWLAMGLALKSAYWKTIDAAPRTHTAEAATGLGKLGKVRPLEPPHTEANYIMREMGYQVARKHALTLRWFVKLVGFVLPILLLALSMLTSGGVSTFFVVLAVVAAAAGVVVERWLFFAEAEHVVMLYYGAERA
jgi:sulfite dehydrogenase (quinone) subunit SoeC